VNNAYRSPAWLIGSHVQSIYPYLFLRREPPEYRRERAETPDGDFVDFDWIDGPEDAPLVVLFHGLEGSSRSHYCSAFMHVVRRQGWRGVVAHWRGCSGEPNRLPRAYHSGDWEEVGWMLSTLKPRAGSAPFYAVGISLGGSALLNWLGREADKSREWLAAAAAVSAPIDLVAGGIAIDQGLNRLYGGNFLRTLIPKCVAKERQFPGLFDIRRVKRIRTMRAFDDLVTGPLHGFRDAMDYWSRASSKPHLRGVAVPTLVLNARNDPFIPAESLPGPQEVSAAVTLEQPAHGGHCGFSSGSFPGHIDWLSSRLLEFFEART
jgi:predicted alpha/beta-fold hydrolase